MRVYLGDDTAYLLTGLDCHNWTERKGTGAMDKLMVCRCEEVTLADIQTAASQYKCSAREIKLRTRAGMGFCGGRTCRSAVDAVLEEVTGEKPGHDIPLKVQPPVRPVSLSVLRSRSSDE